MLPTHSRDEDQFSNLFEDMTHLGSFIKIQLQPSPDRRGVWHVFHKRPTLILLKRLLCSKSPQNLEGQKNSYFVTYADFVNEESGQGLAGQFCSLGCDGGSLVVFGWQMSCLEGPRWLHSVGLSPFWNVTQGSQRVSQETGRGSCLLLKAWPAMLAWCVRLVIYWTKQSQSPPEPRGWDTDPPLKGNNVKKNCSHISS